MAAQDNLQPHQLKMFMSPDEIIDGSWKGDSAHHRSTHSPRAQWEEPSPYHRLRGEPEPSLRDKKLGEITSRNEKAEEEGTTPYSDYMHRGLPLSLHHDAEVYGGTPMLDDGHHRLAYAERKRTPYIPVKHSGV